MKNSILVSATALLISTASFAQSDLVRKNPQDTVIVEGNQKKHTDGVMMTEGTMKLVRNEIISPMVAEITMNNGTVVSVDGTYVKTDQTRTKLKEGEHMDMEGVITDMKDSEK